MEETIKQKRKSGMSRKKTHDAIFYWGLLFIPLAVWVVRYIYININSILLSFRTYDDSGALVFYGVNNFKQVITDFMKNEDMNLMLRNSLKVYALNLVFTTTVPIFVSYYLFKKYPLTSFLKVMLYVPHIISGLVTVMMFKFIVDRVMPGLGWIKEGLLTNELTRYGTIMFYTLWASFGAGILMQVGAMNSTDQATIEAGQVDGVGFWQEFWYIVLPCAYKVLVIGFVTGIDSIFTNQFGLYSFYGPNAPENVRTMGYYYYIRTLNDGDASYPYWASWGLLASSISIPLTFLVRWIMNKIGPSEE